jgi:hypothetical protein
MTTSEKEAVLPLPALPSVQFWLLVRALCSLVMFDLIAVRRGFAGVQRWVTARKAVTPELSSRGVEEIFSAVERACSYYPKTAVCLQRSAVLTKLLKKHGIKAQLVIGVKHFPFRSHAWVEVDDIVVNDNQRVREVYSTIDRW